MRVLLTGSSGLLGSSVRRILCEAGVECLAGSLRGPTDHLDAPKAEVLLHFSAVTSAADFDADPTGSYRTNILGTYAALQYCLRTGARLVFASSSAVYRPDSKRKTFDEDSAIGSSRHYGLSKIVGEALCFAMARDFEIAIVVLRFFNLYGPGQRSPFLIPDIMHAAASSTPLSLKMPNAVRDFVFVDDAAKAAMLAMQLPTGTARTFNIGSGVGRSVDSVVQEVARISGARIQIVSSGSASGETESMVADCTAARLGLGWQPTISFAEGLARTWQEFKHHTPGLAQGSNPRLA